MEKKKRNKIEKKEDIFDVKQIRFKKIKKMLYCYLDLTIQRRFILNCSKIERHCL
jgi:hypothetical protein